MPLLWRCLALFPISRLLGISRDNESLLFLSNACELCLCNVTRWKKGKNQGRKERNRPKIAHKTVPTPTSNSPEAFAPSDILNTTEMGRDTESLLRSHRCDEKWKIRIFLAHVCQSLSFLRFHNGNFLAFSLFEQRTLGSNAEILILMGDSHK